MQVYEAARWTIKLLNDNNYVNGARFGELKLICPDVLLGVLNMKKYQCGHCFIDFNELFVLLPFFFFDVLLGLNKWLCEPCHIYRTDVV